MDIETVKSFLGAVRLKQQALNSLIARRDEILASAAAPGCGCYDEVNAGRANRSGSDRTGNAVARAGELEEKAQAVFNEYLTAYKEVRSVIDDSGMPPLCMLVLRRRYLIGDNWACVAASLGLTRSYIMRLHKKALEFLAAAC